MNKGTIHVLIAMSLVGASAFAAKERVIRFQNHVRLGYDSNIYGTADAEGSAFLTDIVNLSGKMNFSSRTMPWSTGNLNFNIALMLIRSLLPIRICMAV